MFLQQGALRQLHCPHSVSQTCSTVQPDLVPSVASCLRWRIWRTMNCQVCHLPRIVILLSVVQMAAAELVWDPVASVYPGVPERIWTMYIQQSEASSLISYAVVGRMEDFGPMKLCQAGCLQEEQLPHLPGKHIPVKEFWLTRAALCLLPGFKWGLSWHDS